MYLNALSVIVAYISVHHEGEAPEQGCCGLLLDLIGKNQTSLAAWTANNDDKHVLLLLVDLHRPKNPPPADFLEVL